MYTKEQMKSFGDWLASRKDVVTGSQIDEYIAGIATVGGADVVERVAEYLASCEIVMDITVNSEREIVTQKIKQKDSVCMATGLVARLAPIIEAEVERRVRERSKE